MPVAFDYAVIRVVPRVEREEFLNVGVAIFCPDRESLAARFELIGSRLEAFAPSLDVDLVREHLDAFVRACAGEGPLGELPIRERWHWLVAPRSTIIQTSAAHAGLCEMPTRTMDSLLDRYVRLLA